MRKFLAFVFLLVLLATSLVNFSSTPASAAPTLTTCTDLSDYKTIALKATQKSCNPLLAPATWHLQQSDSPVHTGAGYATLRICSSKNPAYTYQFIKSACPKYQVTSDYWRAITTPEIPLIKSITASGFDSALFTLSPTITSSDSPIAYYLVTNLKTGQVNKLAPNYLSQLSLTNLSALTTYTFQVTAVSVDGTSSASPVTEAITTQAVPVAAPSVPALAAPAFTLSSASEIRTVGSALAGYTISSTGGTIASYAISPAAPAGLSFSTSTGLLTGTPTSVASATAYTITATNASGSATRTFTLTVTSVGYAVGDRGPGGGIVFYVSATVFSSPGSTCNTACRYLEYAPATWQSEIRGGGVSRELDRPYQWSSDATTSTGQDTTTATTEGFSPDEKFNWKIGQGLYNTSVMKVSGTTSAAQAAVLAYGASDSSTGQWFIPSMNELNELCKYARGQTTGDTKKACDTSGTLKTGTSYDYAGFVSDTYYWSSSERNTVVDAFYQGFGNGEQSSDNRDGLPGVNVRPVRAL